MRKIEIRPLNAPPTDAGPVEVPLDRQGLRIDLGAHRATLSDNQLGLKAHRALDHPLHEEVFAALDLAPDRDLLADDSSDFPGHGNLRRDRPEASPSALQCQGGRLSSFPAALDTPRLRS